MLGRYIFTLLKLQSIMNVKGVVFKKSDLGEERCPDLPKLLMLLHIFHIEATRLEERTYNSNNILRDA